MSANAKTKAKTKSKNVFRFTITERMVMSNTLPKEGNFTDNLIRGEIFEKIAINQKDISKHKIEVSEDGKTSFRDTGIPYEFDFTDIEQNYIWDWLKKMSDDEKLSVDLNGVYKQFNK